MNDMIKTILSRRSIRRYTTQPVSREMMETVLSAASAAPSAKNFRPVRFIVLNKQDMAALSEYIAQKEPFQAGQWAIAVCGDTRGYQGSTGWLEDCAAAMENMQIACTALGLGSFWYGLYRRAPKEGQVRAFLHLPEGVEICGITVMGYPAESHRPYEGFKPEFVRYGRWNE